MFGGDSIWCRKGIFEFESFILNSRAKRNFALGVLTLEDLG